MNSISVSQFPLLLGLLMVKKEGVMFPRFAQERISFPRAMSSVGAVKADIGLIFGILACCGPRQAFPVNVKIVLWVLSCFFHPLFNMYYRPTSL